VEEFVAIQVALDPTASKIMVTFPRETDLGNDGNCTAIIEPSSIDLFDKGTTVSIFRLNFVSNSDLLCKIRWIAAGLRTKFYR